MTVADLKRTPAPPTANTVSSDVVDRLLEGSNILRRDGDPVQTVLPVGSTPGNIPQMSTPLPGQAVVPVPAASAGMAAGLIAWVKNNPLPAAAIGAALVYVIYTATKGKK